MPHAALHGLVALLAATAAPAQAPTPSPTLTFDRIFAPDASGKRAEQIAWRPDGGAVSYLWDDGSGKKLWQIEVASNEAKPLLDLAALPKGEDGKEASELASYLWSPTSERLVLVAGGDLFQVALAEPQLRRLTETAAKERQPSFSPDGTRLAFVRDADLYLIDLASGKEARLTHDGEPDRLLNGTTDWLYWEELWNREWTGYWWRPDGGAIAFYRFDLSGVGRFPLLDERPLYPVVDWQRYPKAGEPNPRVRVGVLDLGSRLTAWMNAGGENGDYLARVHWSPDGRRLGIERLAREQNRLEFLACSAASGDCSPLFAETAATWVKVGDDTRWLGDGRLLWASEREGWRRLYRFDERGQGLAISPDGWEIESIDALREADGFALVTAYRTFGGLGPIERHVARLALDGSSFEVLTRGRGWHGALAPPRGDFWVETESDADSPPRAALRRLGGGAVSRLPASPPPELNFAELPRWEFLLLPGPGGVQLPARMLKPKGLPSGAKLPAVMYHYGGPGSQVVVDRWGGARELWHKALAERGVIVLQLDNQASAFFGRRGEDRLHRRFGELELAAQLAGVDYLKTLPFVDAQRIGLWGWSGGGTNTLYSVLARPGIWKAAVAVAPVTDWRLYDSVWTERYLDHPADNPEGYRLSSPVTYAEKLADPLLLVHGSGDDNVHPQNSTRLVERFIEAGRPFEQALYPHQGHGLRGPSLRHLYERMTAFFARHLGFTW